MLVTSLIKAPEELTKIANDSEASDEDILKSKYINKELSKANDLYKEKRIVQNSDITDKEKQKEVLILQKQIDDIFKKRII